MRTAKVIRKTHKYWLRDFQTSYDMQKPLDYTSVTPRRLDILFDMGLVKYNPNPNAWGQYTITDLGKQILSNFN